MKRQFRIIAALIAGAAALTVSAFAAQTVDVKGYVGEDMVQFSITNVTKTQEITPAGRGTLAIYAYDVDKSGTITVKDKGLSFDVIPGKLIDGTWRFAETEEKESRGMYFDSVAVKDVAGCPTLDGEEYIMPSHAVGCSVTLSDEGVYLVIAQYEALAGAAIAYVDVGGGHIVNDTTEQPETAKPEAIVAKAAMAKVLVDGEEVAFQAYEIAGNNYFKLRDLAMAVSGTTKQFEVSWDEATSSIALTADKAYTAVGGELAAGDGVGKTAKTSSAAVTKHGEPLTLTAYEIADNNYFKLRDVAKVFDIGIGWDEATQTITVDTAASYTE